MAPAASPEGLEVRCAGCGETLEVDSGLTEFICPDCATPQSLPPELMPPPPPRRKALPLPRAAADVRGARIPCGSCGALLSVPVGLARCACPVCGAELAVDTARLRHYLLSSATAEGAIPVVPVGDSSATPILKAHEVRQEHPNYGICVGHLQTEPDNRPNCMEQGQAKRPNQLIPEQADLDNPYDTSEGEEARDVDGIVTRHTKQTNIRSVGPGIVSAEKRHGEPLNHIRDQAQVKCSTTHMNCTTGRLTALQTVNIEKRQPLTPNQIIQQAHKQPFGRAICTENACPEDGDRAIHVQEKQQQHGNQANHKEELCTQVVNEIIAGDSNKKGVKCTAQRDATGADKRTVHQANEAIKEVQQQQSDSVIHMESENQVVSAEKEQSKSSGCRILKRKKKGLTAASNSGLQLRRSKRLAKDSPASLDQEPVQNDLLELPASPGGQASDTVIDNEPTEIDPDEQHAGSPDQSLSDSPDIDRIINNICPSPSPRHEVPESSSNELDSLNLTTPPSCSHLDLSDPEQFARNYMPPEIRKALADLGSNSLLEDTMSQASSGEACLRDLTDSEGDEPWTSSRQNDTSAGAELRWGQTGPWPAQVS